MTEPLSQRDLLIRYLLGVASEQERTAVEEQYFADDTGLEVLLRAEDELIDDYVRGVLSDSDRQLFESHFLCTEARRERLETVKSFVETLAQTKYATESISPEVIEPSERPALPGQARTSQNRRARDLSSTQFEQLLQWLAPDVEKAGEKYEAIRRRLIKFFVARGVDNPEELADATIDRVASRSSDLLQKYVRDPERYIHGVARLLVMQAARSQARLYVSAPLDAQPDEAYTCFEKCLEHLSKSDRELLMEFYATKEHKAENRRELAQSLGISTSALRLRVFSLKQRLKKCIDSCLQETRDKVDDR